MVIRNPLYGNRCEPRKGHQCKGVGDMEIWAISLFVSSGPSQAQSRMCHFHPTPHCSWVCWPLYLWVGRNPAHDRHFGTCSIDIYPCLDGLFLLQSNHLSEDILQMVYSSLPQIAWPCSRTPEVCAGILLWELTRASTQHPFLPRLL